MSSATQTRSPFPKQHLANPDGLLAVGGDLEPWLLETAYRQGVFPWPVQGEPIYWFCPHQRAVLFFEKLHIPKRLTRSLKKNQFLFTHNQNFLGVIRGCANRKDTWITNEMITAYHTLFKLGKAHSFEVYLADDKTSQKQLVGGLYGVWLDNYFAAESMFCTQTDASKFALIKACEFLKEKDLQWMDVQVINPHLKRFGACEITQAEFLKLLNRALNH